MTIATEYQREVIKLRDRIAWLEAEVDLYKHKPPQNPQPDIRRIYNLTPSMATILRLLAGGHVCSVDRLHEEISRPNSGINTVRVQVCRLRKAIWPIKISYLRNDGYFLAGENLSEIRAIVAGRKSPSAAKKLLGVSE